MSVPHEPSLLLSVVNSVLSLRRQSSESCFYISSDVEELIEKVRKNKHILLTVANFLPQALHQHSMAAYLETEIRLKNEEVGRNKPKH